VAEEPFSPQLGAAIDDMPQSIDERRFGNGYVDVPNNSARVAMDRDGDYPRESISVKVSR